MIFTDPMIIIAGTKTVIGDPKTISAEAVFLKKTGFLTETLLATARAERDGGVAMTSLIRTRCYTSQRRIILSSVSIGSLPLVGEYSCERTP